MNRLCEGRVVIVTGAGRGLGRAHSLELARQGARVVVNDLGSELDGSGTSSAPAEDVVRAITEMGGEAVANADDIADWEAADHLVTLAFERFGTLDAVVNNAGFVRDRMFVSCGEEDWDAVMRVHLRGHFAVARHAAVRWREQHKAGEPVQARIVNTTSGAGLLGSIGQSAYSTAKAGIVGLTLVQAAELARYGVTANAIAPAARTRMTETVFAEAMAAPNDPDGFDAMSPENVSPLVAWLVSRDSRLVTGRVFEICGGNLTVADGWRPGTSMDKQCRWDADELGPVVRRLIEGAPHPLPVYGSA